MVCPQLIGAHPRISARRGQVVDLNVDFYRSGIPTDPYAIRYVEIYKTQVVPHNLVATIPILDPDNPLYPSPLCIEEDTSGSFEGKYHLPYLIPDEFIVPDVYFDLWYYFPTNPCPDETGCDMDSIGLQPIKCCHRFWIYPDEWFCNDSLQTIRFAFEPLDQKFHASERRPLEVGIMPLPLYDYNFNLVTPIIPFLRPQITIETRHCELLVDHEAAEIAIRHGSFRSNPWVIRYMLESSRFLKGTYSYFITLNLPDGSNRVSRKFVFTIS